MRLVWLKRVGLQWNKVYSQSATGNLCTRIFLLPWPGPFVNLIQVGSEGSEGASWRTEVLGDG